jgi:hypothetical protein
MTPYVKSLIRASLCVAALSSAQAATLTFERSQTLNGWHERAHTGKVWYDLAPDFKHLLVPDVNGDVRGFEQGFSSKWLRSPAFKQSSKLRKGIILCLLYIVQNECRCRSWQ